MRQRTILALAKLADRYFTYTIFPDGKTPVTYERTDWFAEVLFENELADELVLGARALGGGSGSIKVFVQDAWLNYGKTWRMHDDDSKGGRERAFIKLANALLEYAHRPREQTLVKVSDRSRNEAEAALRLDGLIWHGGRLQRSGESAFDVVEATSLLVELYRECGLPGLEQIEKELADIDDHYETSKWGDVIKHARDLLELTLKRTAIDVYKDKADSKMTEQSRALQVREALSRASFWSEKEKDFVDKLYQLLSDQGGHPNLSGQDSALICRQYTISAVHFVLLRLKSLK